MKKVFTMNTNKTQKLIKEYIKNTYSKKLETQEEMGKFLDTYD
jgi:hypothetical protein